MLLRLDRRLRKRNAITSVPETGFLRRNSGLFGWVKVSGFGIGRRGMTGLAHHQPHADEDNGAVQGCNLDANPDHPLD